MFDKFLTSLISLSFLILGTYETNNPELNNIAYSFVNDNLVIECSLEKAFENDFQKIFKSGKPINIWFSIKIKNNNKTITKSKFRHSVTFDPIEQEYQVFREENRETLYFKEWELLLQNISQINFETNLLEPGTYSIQIESYLEKIRLSKNKKSFNLMALWKFKKPKLKAQLSIET